MRGTTPYPERGSFAAKSGEDKRERGRDGGISGCGVRRRWVPESVSERVNQQPSEDQRRHSAAISVDARRRYRGG